MGDYCWYVFILEDNWRDDLRNEVRENFEIFAKESGRHILTIRGFDCNEFYGQVFRKYSLENNYKMEDIERPALLITDTHPNDISGNPEDLFVARIILLELRPYYEKHKSTIPFLQELIYSLSDTEAFDSLIAKNKSMIVRKWGWLNRYLDLKPNFMGFGININEIISRFMKGE